MTLKLGWCLSGQHAGDPNVAEYQQCPGQQWNHICPCECHEKHPPKVPIPEPMAQRPAPAPKPEPKPVPRKTKQRRKLL